MIFIKLSIRCWLFTSLLFGLLMAGLQVYLGNEQLLPYAVLSVPAALIGSVPAWLFLMLMLSILRKSPIMPANKWAVLFMVIALLCLPYGFLYAMLEAEMSQGGFDGGFIGEMLLGAGVLFCCNAAAVSICRVQIDSWINPAKAPEDINLQQSVKGIISYVKNLFILINSNKKNMESETSLSQQETGPIPEQVTGQFWNKPIIKAIVTGVLILLMLIPTSYINQLVEERKDRQAEVAAEVSDKWAKPQTITTPYLYIPYNTTAVDDKGKVLVTRNYLLAIAENLDVKSNIETTLRARSIYQVLLYRTKVNLSGDFKIKLPKFVDRASLLLNEARLCIGISDFKGIEEKLNLQWGDSLLDMEPGLPITHGKETGLSASLNLDSDQLSQVLPFKLEMKLKGTEKLHFIPLSSNSHFEFRSDWPSPSFDGHSIPREHTISDSGFIAKWSFNQANLPFPPVMNNTGIAGADIAFGVSLLQPGDHYGNTLRSVKYALLFIGLTFAFFFIIEVTQNKSVHPVQYVLIGLALVIFYTLLLSISEFIGFDIAYLIAASATSLLIGLYGQSLFASAKTSISLSLFILGLYGFIYTLIQLEDTALLAGSIGLFLLLGAAMYFSRRVQWYGTNQVVTGGQIPNLG